MANQDDKQEKPLDQADAKLGQNPRDLAQAAQRSVERTGQAVAGHGSGAPDAKGRAERVQRADDQERARNPDDRAMEGKKGGPGQRSE